MTQQAKSLETQVIKSVRLNYLLHLPPDYGAGKQCPLILFLHGRDERGEDVEILKRHGLPKLIGEQPDFPFIVVSPQCPADSDWSVEMDGVIALLDHVTRNYAVDLARVYLTGLSMGGRGAYHLAALQPQRFAALVPICGSRPDVLRRAERMRALIQLPTWIFHGALDSIVSVNESLNIAEELKSFGGNVRLTIYPDLKHNAWQRTYENPELYGWMLEQKQK